MPMGIVSDEDFKDAVEDTSGRKKSVPTPIGPTPVTGEVIDLPTKGRGLGNMGVPNSLRNVIGEESATNGRDSALEIAKHFGISPSSVSAYANGATSTSSYDQTPNKPVITQARERIAKRARGKLMRALNNITGDKLESSSAKDLAGIAKDMAGIVKTMEPEPEKANGSSEGKGPTFVIYAPQMRKEESYEIIHVKE